MKVKIVKCSIGSSWYEVGEMFYVVEADKDFYRFSPSKTILKSDCEVIEEVEDYKVSSNFLSLHDVPEEPKDKVKSCNNCFFNDRGQCLNESDEACLVPDLKEWHPSYSKPKEAKSCDSCKYYEVRNDAVECRTCVEEEYRDWKPKVEKVKQEKLVLKISRKKFNKIQAILCVKCYVCNEDCDAVCNLDRYIVK